MEEGLQRRLTSRQLTMIAIGGAIGVGLFLGSTVTINLAGPGVIVTYVVGAVIALIMAYALAEMAVVHPVPGAFGVYADRYLSPWLGFLVRATYAFIQIRAIVAVAAGEAQHPERSIPRAMRTMVARLIVFYVLAISVMLMMTPWQQIGESGGGVTGSPFVRTFTAIGIPYAAGAMNLVVITAA